jgi:NAD(P)H-nitrite reductase large subunit
LRYESSYRSIYHNGLILLLKYLCGFKGSEILEMVREESRKYSVEMKIKSAAHIAFLGIKEEDVDAIWSDLGTEQGYPTGLCVRSLKVCTGNRMASQRH